jgi:hypothetical protein
LRQRAVAQPITPESLATPTGADPSESESDGEAIVSGSVSAFQLTTQVRKLNQRFTAPNGKTKEDMEALGPVNIGRSKVRQEEPIATERPPARAKAPKSLKVEDDYASDSEREEEMLKAALELSRSHTDLDPIRSQADAGSSSRSRKTAKAAESKRSVWTRLTTERLRSNVKKEDILESELSDPADLDFDSEPSAEFSDEQDELDDDGGQDVIAASIARATKGKRPKTTSTARRDREEKANPVKKLERLLKKEVGRKLYQQEKNQLALTLVRATPAHDLG